MPAVREILIGRRTGDHALLEIRGRLFPDGDDPGWLWLTLTVQAAGFGCRRDGNLHLSDLRRFRTALEELHESGGSGARLSTEDEWLAIDMAPGDDSVAARIRVQDEGPPPAELRCGLTGISPAGMMTTIESLAAVDRAYA